MIIEENKLVVITEQKAIYFDLPKKVDNSLKHKIDFITKDNEFLAEYKKQN